MSAPGIHQRADRDELRVQTARGWVTVDAVASGVVRVRILDSATHIPAHSYAIEDELPTQPATVTSRAVRHIVETGEMTVTVAARTGALTARTASGATFIDEPSRGFRRMGQGFRWRSRLADDETSHGLGERSFGLSLRGRRYRLWNYAPGGYRPGQDPLYLNVPFYLGQRSGLSYGIFFDCPARATIGLDVRGDGLLTFASERRPPVMYIILGADAAEVVRRFTGLVGRMELPPLWSLGYQHSRWGLRDAAAFTTLAARTRAERIPCDALHFDIDYMDGRRVFTWDRRRFKDPASLLDAIAADGFRAVAILDPAVKVDQRNTTYRAGVQRGVFLRKASGGRLVRRVWAGPSEFPDFTDPACRQWWAEQAASLASDGLDGLWTDMNEPSAVSLGHTLPDTVPHVWEGEGNTHVGGGHAVYGMQMARATRDGLVALRPDRRPFVFSRAGYAGLQRYASSWNGDSEATWEHLRMTIPQLLNLGLSGVSFTGSDVGGFKGNPSAELYLRWMQLASMTPFFRTHSTRRARERNPWTFGEPTTGRVRDIVGLRYRLLPYLYTAFHQASADGTPIIRPLFLSDADPAVRTIEDQFLLGDHLLVAPIMRKGARSRPVVLPSGGWYRFEAATLVRGGRTIRDAAGVGLPLYVRAGAVVPTWPVQQHVGEGVGTLTLDVYAGSATSRMYEDAGEGYAYREGDSRVSTFTSVARASARRGTCRALRRPAFTLSWQREGSFEPAYATVVVRLFGLRDPSAPITVDGATVAGHVEDGVVTVTTGTFGSLRVG